MNAPETLPQREAATSAAIMQPTYLPWIGYFSLMDQVDCFVLLDSVQFDKRSWQQRNRIKTTAGETMLTLPVKTKNRSDQKINEVRIDNSRGMLLKHLRAIEFNYRKSLYFDRYWPHLQTIFKETYDYLFTLNTRLIDFFREELAIKTRMLCSSQLACTGKRSLLLLNLCRAVGARQYVSPPGSRAYIEEDDAFNGSGLSLSYHQYEHPVYRQLHGDFIPYLSTLDLLMNEGPDSLDIIRSGRCRGAAAED